MIAARRRGATDAPWVRKYGGSSLATPAHLASVASQLVATQATGRPQVVVVSAMGQTTNHWLAQALEVCASPPGRELDMLVSVGERVTSALMAMAIHQAGGRAASFTGSQAGIITTDEHLCAEILEVRPHRVEAALARGEVAVVAGYQGVSRQGEVTTLGRGGSDTTAVALAHALQAARCVLFSDVDGIYTADPRQLCGARRLARVSWSFLAALGRAGARVVAPEASAWAARTHTRLVACRSGAAIASGTQVGAAEPGRPAYSVVVAPHVVRVGSLRTAALPALDAFRRLGARWVASGAEAMWLDLAGVPGRAAQPVMARAVELGYVARPDALVSCVYEATAGGFYAESVDPLGPSGATLVHQEAGLRSWSVAPDAAYRLAGELHAALADAAEVAGPEGPSSDGADRLSPIPSPSRSANSQASAR